MATKKSVTKSNQKQSMYLYMLANQLGEASQKFLARAIFDDQEAPLQGVDLTGQSNPITKTDVAVNDKAYLAQLSELFSESHYLKLDQIVVENMLLQLYQTASPSPTTAEAGKSGMSQAYYQVAFVDALLSERTFFINLLRSLLRVVLQVTSNSHYNQVDNLIGGDETFELAVGTKAPFQVPIFQDDDFLTNEFKKLTQSRSQSSMNTSSHQKKYPITRLQQPLIATNKNDTKVIHSVHRVRETTGASPAVESLAIPPKNNPQSISPRGPTAPFLKDSKLATAAASFNQSRTMFDQITPGSASASGATENEYQGCLQTRAISDRALGLAKRARKDCKKDTFSFADPAMTQQEGVYMAEGKKMMTHPAELRLDMVSQSPSFGNLSAKSPHSQHAHRQSRSKNVLREYHQLFKRMETVQLKHKWETDDEDVAADVTSSSSASSARPAGGVGLNKAGEQLAVLSDRDRDRKVNDEGKEHHSDSKKGTPARVKKAAIPVCHHHVQKPDTKNIITGKRANVRTSENKRLQKQGATARQSTSRSPHKHQNLVRMPHGQQNGVLVQSVVSHLQQQLPQQQQQSSVLFSQSKGKKGQPQSYTVSSVQGQIKNKATSRNNKTGDLYTKSVPSLGTDKTKTAKEMSSVASTDLGEKKQKLLKDASLALAMTMSPKSQPKNSGSNINGKKIQNPQLTQTAGMERTYQSLSSNKKKKPKASGQQSSRSPESSNCSKGSKERGQARKKREGDSSVAVMKVLDCVRGGDVGSGHYRHSPYRYSPAEHRESLCEPNGLVQQLRQEQETEYASHTSSSLHNMHKGGPPLMPTEKGAVTATLNSGQTSHSSHQKQLRLQKVGTQPLNSEQDEYELGKAGRKHTLSSSKQHLNRMIGSQATSKQSQSKLLATSTAGGSQLIIEGPTQPKKLDKDAKLLFPQSGSQAAQKKAKLAEAAAGKVMLATRQSSIPSMNPTSNAPRRNSDYHHQNHLGASSSSTQQKYKIKSARDAKEAGATSVPIAAQIARHTSETTVAAKQSPKLGAQHQHTQSMPHPANAQVSAARNKKLGTSKISVCKSVRRATESADSANHITNHRTNGTKQSQQRSVPLQMQQSPSTHHESPSRPLRTQESQTKVVKQLAGQIPELDKPRNSKKTRQQQSTGRAGHRQPAAASSAYGNVKVNAHQDSSHSSSFAQSSGHGRQHMKKREAFPSELLASSKSSRRGEHLRSSQPSENQSYYDDDAEETEQIARYTREVLRDKVFPTSARQSSQGFDTGSLHLQLEHGPQTFEKESEDADGDGEPRDIRQQIFFIDRSGASQNGLKVSLAQLIDEPDASEKSVNADQPMKEESRDNRAQVHQLFKPSESVAQSYQHEEGDEDVEALIGDDQEALFEHLNQSDTNQDAGQSRRETQEDHLTNNYPACLGEQVSDIVQNESLIQRTSESCTKAAHSGNRSDLNQFSVHARSLEGAGGSIENEHLHSGTVGTDQKMQHYKIQSNLGGSSSSQLGKINAKMHQELNWAPQNKGPETSSQGLSMIHRPAKGMATTSQSGSSR